MAETKRCTKCGEEKPLEKFSQRSGRPLGHRASACIACLGKAQRERYKGNAEYREKQRQWSAVTYARLKEETIAAYGGKCACCGEREPRFLTIDHVNGDGAQARRIRRRLRRRVVL